jgi:hypothetical protein
MGLDVGRIFLHELLHKLSVKRRRKKKEIPHQLEHLENYCVAITRVDCPQVIDHSSFITTSYLFHD